MVVQYDGEPGEVFVRQGGRAGGGSWLAAHQWATGTSGNLRMRVWVAQWVAQWQTPLMMQRLLSKEWICFHHGTGMGPWAGGAGRGQSSGVEWSWANGRGELERPGKPHMRSSSLVQLQHSSVLLLQFARLPSQMQPAHYSLLPSLPSLPSPSCSAVCSAVRHSDCSSLESSAVYCVQPPPSF
jgi:hypothetical protein